MGARLPTPEELRRRAPATHTLVCLALCALILGFAAGDLAHTESRLPEESVACRAAEAACRDAGLSEQVTRDRAATPLQDRYDSRAWLYSFAILAIVALTVAYALRSSPRSEWPRIFTNLGVTGVWLGLGAVVLLLATDGNSVSPPPAPTLRCSLSLTSGPKLWWR